MNRPRYIKKPVTADDLKIKISLRGLDLSDTSATDQAFKYVGYYRLRGYFYPYYVMDLTDPRKPTPKEPKVFHTGISIQNVLDLYEFDRKLRLIVLEEVQKVEVALRTRISEHMCTKYNNAHWFMDMSIVGNDFNHQKFFEQIGKTKETFIQHYLDKYDSPKYPPSWMIVETLSFGAWSRAYSELLTEDKKDIARDFNVEKSDVMESWFHTLTHLRNLCAHHSRIWNRNFYAFPPKTYNTIETHLTGKKNTIYSRLAVLRYISNNVSISNGMTDRLCNLFQSLPTGVTLEKMGFYQDWQIDPLWY